jgi:cobalt-zinc-cadmium efflux system outer membrane protein
LTLDEAIARLLSENHDLRARFSEIPQAWAEILSAGLRANPFVYADSQLVPYGRYTRSRPGGQTQDDINISYPLDTTRKRPARTVVAAQAKRVLETQYQDAARMAIDSLYTAYVDVLAAGLTVRSAWQCVQELDRASAVTRRRAENDEVTRADLNRVRIQQESAQVHLLDTEAQLGKAKRALAAVLSLSEAKADLLELSGSIFNHSAPPPRLDSLIALALENRPDLGRCRLALRSSELDPESSRNIESSMANLEQAIRTEVQLAHREYEITREAVRRIEQQILPRAEQVLKDTWQLYDNGEINTLAHLHALRDSNDTLAMYHDTLVRHRRSVLALNTVVGVRIMP